MDIRVHERTKKIQILSKRLFYVLLGTRFVLYLGWPALIFVALANEGTLVVGDSTLQIEEIDFLIKALVLSLFGIGLGLMLRLTHFFRELMRHFMSGDVFSNSAIQNVKEALKTGVFIIAMSVVLQFVGWGLSLTIDSEVTISFLAELVFAVVYLGLMYTLLWVLEIGVDLNEESEKTI